jgi:hypothetical protein
VHQITILEENETMRGSIEKYPSGIKTLDNRSRVIAGLKGSKDSAKGQIRKQGGLGKNLTLTNMPESQSSNPVIFIQ